MKRKLLLAALALIGVMSASAKVTFDTDFTSKFPVDWQGWEGATGFVGWAAPEVQTNDGRTTAACERYNDNGGNGVVPGIGDIFTRTLEGLTNGTYRIELYGAAAYTPDRGIATEMTADNEGDMTAVYLYAETAEGTVKQYIPVHWATSFSEIATAVLENVVVTDGTVKIGMYKEKMYTNWQVVQIKGVTATVDGDELLDNTKAEAASLLNSPMNADIKEALQAAYNAEPEQNAEAYQEAIDELDAAIADAQASIAVYATVKAQLDIADELDENGKAAYTSSDAYIQVSEAYEDGSLEEFSTEQETALAEALREAAKKQTADGANFTYAIINPDFETGNTNGWTGEISSIMSTNELVKVGNYFVEFYAGTGFDGTKSIQQTISNMPAGSYRLTANIISRGTSSVKVFAGNTKADAFIYTGAMEARRCTVEFTLDDTQDLTIGVEAEGSGVDVGYDAWVGVDDFTLELVKSVKVTVGGAGYATFSSAFSLDLSEVDAYIVTKPAEDETITLDPCKGIVPAKTGIIIAGNGEVEIPIAAANAETIDVEDNLLVATDGGTVEADNYVLATVKGADEAAFYVLEEAKDIEAGKAYLKAEAASATNAAKALRIVFGDGTATAIETVATEAEADGALYNVAGQQVGNDYKGIVIKNGKKYLNK